MLGGSEVGGSAFYPPGGWAVTGMRCERGYWMRHDNRKDEQTVHRTAFSFSFPLPFVAAFIQDPVDRTAPAVGLAMQA